MVSNVNTSESYLSYTSSMASSDTALLLLQGGQTCAKLRFLDHLRIQAQPPSCGPPLRRYVRFFGSPPQVVNPIWSLLGFTVCAEDGSIVAALVNGSRSTARTKHKKRLTLPVKSCGLLRVSGISGSAIPSATHWSCRCSLCGCVDQAGARHQVALRPQLSGTCVPCLCWPCPFPNRTGSPSRLRRGRVVDVRLVFRRSLERRESIWVGVIRMRPPEQAHPRVCANARCMRYGA